MNSQGQQGIFFDKPAKALIEALDTLVSVKEQQDA